MSDAANRDTLAKEESDNEKVSRSRKKEKLERYEATIRWRVECEERAFHIVNKLIYGCVEPQYLIDCGKFLSTDNYRDIIEERAISTLCGYPLCDKEITNVPKQKYHISTKSNKVYDITERKNFCSNQCFKASKAFQLQIPESPVWARENEAPVDFTLLPHTSTKGIIGKEVVGEPPWKFLDAEMKNLKELDSKSASCMKKEISDEAKAYTHKSKTRKTVSQKEKAFSTNEQCLLSKDSSSNVIADFENLSLTDKDEKKEYIEETPPCLHKEQLCSSLKEHNCGINAFDHFGDGALSEENAVESSDKKDNLPLEKLNALLAKKKNILYGMVDIQETVSTDVSSRKPFETLTNEIDNETQAPTASNLDKSLLCDSFGSISDSKKLAGYPTDSFPSSLSHEAKDSDKTRFQKARNDNTHSHQHPLDRICEVLRLWITDNTKHFLKESESGSRVDVTNVGFANPNVQSGYMDLCKRLDLQEQGIKHGLEELTDHKEHDSPLANRQSLPDYKYLKEEAEGFQLKVTEFITGKRVKDKKCAEDKDDNSSNPVFLPTVDIYDQRIIRAKIVLDRLDKTFPDLLGPMGLTMQDVSSNLRDLIYSFRLERDNIVFKPSEWTLVALILLKMLAIKVCVVNSAFKTEKVLRYLDILLQGIGHNHHDLHDAVDSLLQ